ncbi:MFS transporter [Novosphingobium terrae]|uniref:MFS transporter n=1 Tax=Novosphingobium terrae TaxID=2726189 RepID=UPI001F141E4F|nr:MFS transporter [Novosphingobium terrae]
MTQPSSLSEPVPAHMGLVVGASAAASAFEWYDFYIFGTLAPVISAKFFAGLAPTAAYIAALALFGAGFAFRPLGALIFGRLGDRLGRKSAFLITVLMMGGATFAIGLLPTYQQLGLTASALVILMRIIQGTALGGVYGGAAISVAEHAPANRRGYLGSYVQTSAPIGLLVALLVVLGLRTALGPVAFDAWGWRLCFLASVGLLAISVFMRMKMTESPLFAKIESEGDGPPPSVYRETFGNPKNLRLIVLAFFSMMCAQGAVFYTAYFYVQVFLEKSLRLDPKLTGALLMGVVALSAPVFVLAGYLSDRYGRKKVMLAGMLIALVAYFPGFHGMQAAGNPAQTRASAEAPVVVVADPADCDTQFDPIGKAQFNSSCNIAKSFLANEGVPYSQRPAPQGSLASIAVGAVTIPAPSAKGLSTPAATTIKADFAKQAKRALARAGYPDKADPAQVNKPALFGLMLIFGISAALLYGPLSTAAVELFPTRIRYTALSVPYHVGVGWVGGFLPFSVFAIVTGTGDLFAGLWYPFVFTAISFVSTLFFLPETSGRSLDF